MYPVSLTVQVPNQAAMSAILAVINGDAPPAVVTSNRTAKDPKAVATTATASSSDAGKTEAKPDTAASATSTTSADAPDYNATAKYVTKVSQTKGREAAVGMLKGFGAATLKDVKPEQFADVIAAAKRILGEE